MSPPSIPHDDDELSVTVQSTVGPFRLERRAGGPSQGETDHSDLLAPAAANTEDDS